MSDPAGRARRPTGRPGARRSGDARSGGRRSSGTGGRGRTQDRSSERPARDRSRDRSGGREPEGRERFDIRQVRPRHDDPELPDDVEPKHLDRVARGQLRTLSKENADTVARHLAMAARLIETDPTLAHRHALAAARRAGRIAVVRETLAITAYTMGDFALALRELRTYRRISGRDDQLPMMVDSERGLGRPGRALELGRSVPRASLPAEVRVELAIAMSGARLDLGQAEAALTELQIPELDPDRAHPYSPALFDAYATVLEELGRHEEAGRWLQRSELAAGALAGDEDEDIVLIDTASEEEDPQGTEHHG